MIVYFKRNIYCLLTRITLRYFEKRYLYYTCITYISDSRAALWIRKKKKKKKNRILHRHVTFHVQFYARRDICLEG